MALSIHHPDAERLARELAVLTGESLTEAVLTALRERVTRVQNRAQPQRLREELRAIRLRCAVLPVLDPRSPEAILGYNDAGVPS